MTHMDHKWKQMMAQWRDIEPRPGFEDRVWRRIQTAEPSTAERMGGAFRGWFLAQPAFAHAAALVVGAALGLAALTAGTHSAGVHTDYDMSILRNGSLAGSYAQLVVGGMQP